MSKKQSYAYTGSFKIGLILLIISISFVSIGFGYYLGKSASTQYKETNLHADWKTYKSPEGWQLNYPLSLDGPYYEKSKAYDYIYDSNAGAEYLVFSEKFDEDTFNKDAAQYNITLIENAQKLSLAEWVERWKTQELRVCRCNLSPFTTDKLTSAGGYAMKGFVTSPSELGVDTVPNAHFILAIQEDLILHGVITVSNGTSIHPSTIYQFRDMLATFTK